MVARDPGVGIADLRLQVLDLRWNWPNNLSVGFHLILGGGQSCATLPLPIRRFRFPLRHVETIVQRCADAGRALVSVVLFGSAAIGGWVTTWDI